MNRATSMRVLNPAKTGDACLYRLPGETILRLASVTNTYRGACWMVTGIDGIRVELPHGTDVMLLPQADFPDLPPLRDLPSAFPDVESARELFAQYDRLGGKLRPPVTSATYVDLTKWKVKS